MHKTLAKVSSHKPHIIIYYIYIALFPVRQQAQSALQCIIITPADQLSLRNNLSFLGSIDLQCEQPFYKRSNTNKLTRSFTVYSRVPIPTWENMICISEKYFDFILCLVLMKSHTAEFSFVRLLFK